jgi:glycine cleavage system regulatory protein
MDQLVITILGDDRAGLVDALSGAISRHGGNWERSQMIELAGKFAGVVLVKIAPSKADALRAELDQIEASGLLNIELETATVEADDATKHQFDVEITGQDYPGIVYEISHALAQNGVNLEEFSSEVVPAPMGGEMFKASAVVKAPESTELADLQDIIEAVATDLLVDVDPHND